jgi:hypothetical protein
MSGGSFEYLYLRDGLDLVADHKALIAMVNRLEEWAPNSQAFNDARHLLSEIQEIAQRLANMPDASLQRIFHDVEWAVNNDISIEQAMEHIREYENRF